MKKCHKHGPYFLSSNAYVASYVLAHTLSPSLTHRLTCFCKRQEVKCIFPGSLTLSLYNVKLEKNIMWTGERASLHVFLFLSFLFSWKVRWLQFRGWVLYCCACVLLLPVDCKSTGDGVTTQDFVFKQKTTGRSLDFPHSSVLLYICQISAPKKLCSSQQCVWAVTGEKIWENCLSCKFLFQFMKRECTIIWICFKMSPQGNKSSAFQLTGCSGCSHAKLGRWRLTVKGHVASALCCWVGWQNNEPHRPVWFPLETAERESDPYTALAPANPICFTPLFLFASDQEMA